MNKNIAKQARRRSNGLPQRTVKSGHWWLVPLIVVLASCATSPPPVRPQNIGKPIKTSESSPQEDKVVAQTMSNPSIKPGVSETEIYEGTGVYIDEEAAAKRPDPVAEDGEIVLNFEGESIQSVVHTILGEVLQETFVIGPGVSGEVTFSTSKPVSRDQLKPI